MKSILMNKNTEVLVADFNVKNIKRTHISKLSDLSQWFANLLHKYQDLTGYSDRRINRLCILLNKQINKLKKLIEEN